MASPAARVDGARRWRLLIALALIATEWVHRTKIALIGAAFVVVTHTIGQAEAIEAVDFETQSAADRSGSPCAGARPRCP